jgi:hypothetical protein
VLDLVTLPEGGWEVGSLHFHAGSNPEPKKRTRSASGRPAADDGRVTDYRYSADDAPGEAEAADSPDELADATRDIADVPAVEVIGAAAVHLMSAAAVKCGLADDPATQTDLDEARKLITALAGLITAAAPEISDSHARPLRDGLRTLQLAFREASTIPDPIGKGPGEKWTGPVT